VRAFARENFGTLLADAERAGELAAERVNAAGEEFLRAVAAHTEASQNLRATVALAHHLRATDTNRSRSDTAAREVRRFLSAGGEVGPRLREDARERMLGAQCLGPAGEEATGRGFLRRPAPKSVRCSS
jgi:hypothetical protein